MVGKHRCDGIISHLVWRVKFSYSSSLPEVNCWRAGNVTPWLWLPACHVTPTVAAAAGMQGVGGDTEICCVAALRPANWGEVAPNVSHIVMSLGKTLKPNFLPMWLAVPYMTAVPHWCIHVIIRGLCEAFLGARKVQCRCSVFWFGAADWLKWSGGVICQESSACANTSFF